MARVRRFFKTRRAKKHSVDVRAKKVVKINRHRINTMLETDDELVMAINSVGIMLRESNNTIISRRMRKKIPYLN